jgi:hypothetical protein
VIERNIFGALPSEMNATPSAMKAATSFAASSSAMSGCVTQAAEIFNTRLN